MRRAPYYLRLSALAVGVAIAAAPAPVLAFSRVKDLIEVQGIRDNMLVGYGLVVGLNGTGDSLKNAPFTQQSIQTMLERLGVNTRGQVMQTKNVAAVMVTASLPAFAAPGTRIAKAVNAYLGGGNATAIDPSNVELAVPANYPGGVMALLTEIEQVKVNPDQPAKVIIDENSGVIVMGADVRISTVAIAQGNLTIKVSETPQVSQPSPFSQTGDTVVVPRTNIQIDDSKGNRMTVLQEGVSLQHVVDGLNALGVGPRDVISILQAIKAAGALQADIQVIG